MTPGPLLGENGDPVTIAELEAIGQLMRLARKWPKSLTLLSMDGTLCVMHSGDERFGAEGRTARHKVVLSTIEGIPNDGGAW